MPIKKLAIGVGIALVVLIAAVWWLFFWGDTPEAVDVDAANTQLDVDLATASANAPATAPEAFDGDINATCVVDDEIGEFDFETASGSFAGFRVDEELTIGEVVAVGRTGGVSGTVTIEGGRLTGTDITVDMGSITSNDTRREFPIRRAVMADEFPTATFVLTTPGDLPVGLADGETATVDAAGDLTVAGTTNEATFTIEALVRDDGFGVITGSATITWEDFGVTPPSAPIVVSIDDSGIIEFQLIVAKG